VRPRHRRGWESQPPDDAERVTSIWCVLVTDGDGSLNTVNWGDGTTDTWCVLVTDGDGSLNTGCPSLEAGALSASSSPTGMGVSTAWAGGDEGLTVVRPRHRRGWESQQGSLDLLVPRRMVRPRHRRGWESQHEHHGDRPGERVRASSSPTGMGVSTNVTAT